MSLANTHTVSLPIMSMLSLDQDEMDSLSTLASHSCPNCDGDITLGEHQAAGVCTDCYFGGMQ